MSKFKRVACVACSRWVSPWGVALSWFGWVCPACAKTIEDEAKTTKGMSER